MGNLERDLADVSYIDEYPELKKKVWLRRLARERDLGVTTLPRVIKFEPKEESTK